MTMLQEYNKLRISDYCQYLILFYYHPNILVFKLLLVDFLILNSLIILECILFYFKNTQINNFKIKFNLIIIKKL